MTSLLNFFEAHTDEALIMLVILCFVLLYMALKMHQKAKAAMQQILDISNQNNQLKEENNIAKLNVHLLEQKVADINAASEKQQQEKTTLQNALSIMERDFSAYKATAVAKEETLAEKIAYLEKIKEDLTLKFKDISSEIIKAQHETFSIEQKNTLSAVINPFAEQLKDFKKEVVATREESIKNKSTLEAELNNLAGLNLNLSREAQNLTEALKGSKKMQGNWGECQLSRILEISGLRKGQDYETQETILNEDKKVYRPDVIIHLPENRDIIVDSKVSLIDYLEAVSAEDEEAKNLALQKNVTALKAHIDELSDKEYQKLLKDRTLNYVIMFIPVESAYIAALDCDRYIYDYAYKKNVILATPLSLLPTLRTIENLWRIDSQNNNVQKIAELGGKIYDKLAAFVDDMKVLENGILQANKAYDKAMTKLTGKGGAVSQAEKMKQLGAKTAKNINLALNDNGLLQIEEGTTSLETAD